MGRAKKHKAIRHWQKVIDEAYRLEAKQAKQPCSTCAMRDPEAWVADHAMAVKLEQCLTDGRARFYCHEGMPTQIRLDGSEGSYLPPRKADGTPGAGLSWVHRDRDPDRRPSRSKGAHLVTDMAQTPIEGWSVIELFGHNKIAGYVRTAIIGTSGMLRVDVPEVDGMPAYTRFYGPGAIYSLTLVTEEIARAALHELRPDAVTVYIPRQLPSPAASYVDHEEYAYDEDETDDEEEDLP